MSLAARVHGRLVVDPGPGDWGLDPTASRAVPRNFFLLLASYVAMKFGDVLSNPKTVLAWLVTAVGAPAAMAGWLVPIRESGALIPQLWLSPWVARMPRRKWLWVAAALAQGLAIAAIAVTALKLSWTAAGLCIGAALAGFALARSLASLATKDVVAKTIPLGQRGQLSGLSTGLAGCAGLVGGLSMLIFGRVQNDVRALVTILLAAGALWGLAAAAYALIREPSSGRPGAYRERSLPRRLGLLRSDAIFRDFVLTRTLLLATALMTPYVVVLGHREIGSGLYVLGAFIVADGVGAMVGAPLWGRLADLSSKRVLRLAGALAGAAGMAAAGASMAFSGTEASAWFLPLAYLALAIAHAGVRVGRSTYLVDFASDGNRTDYVAVSNTVVGVLLLGVGALGLLEVWLTLPGVLALLAGLALAGAAYAGRLPEAEAVF